MTIANQLPSEPETADVLELWRKATMLATNCHAIGTVQAFNEALQTAVVSINYRRSYLAFDATTQTYSNQFKEYPALVDVPVIFLGGGLGNLTFPVTTGDECLLLFNDRDMDNWWGGSATSPVATPRMHSLSDAIAIVGLRSQANVLKTFDAIRAVLSLGTAMVGVGAGGGTLVKIANAGTSLGVLLQTLLADLQAMATGAAAEFSTQAGASTGPLSPLAAGFTALAATFTSLNTTLGTLSTQVSGLLE